MGQSGVLIQSVVEMLCARAKWDRKILKYYENKGKNYTNLMKMGPHL